MIEFNDDYGLHFKQWNAGVTVQSWYMPYLNKFYKKVQESTDEGIAKGITEFYRENGIDMIIQGRDKRREISRRLWGLFSAGGWAIVLDIHLAYALNQISKEEAIKLLDNLESD